MISGEDSLHTPSDDNQNSLNLISSISNPHFCIGVFNAQNNVGDKDKNDYYLVVVNKNWKTDDGKTSDKVTISLNGTALIDTLDRMVDSSINPSWINCANVNVENNKKIINDLEIARGDMALIRLEDFQDEMQSLTNGESSRNFSLGSHTNDITEPNNWRWAEKYYGLAKIDAILGIKDQCNEEHIYVFGDSSGATAEYLMKFGGDYSQLVLRGIADQPAPVIMEVYVDGQLKTTAEWNHGDLCNEMAFIKIDGVEYGTHAVAIRYINDLYQPEQAIDRNFYLDALMFIRTNAVPGLTLGLPKGKFGAGYQSDEVTGVNNWRWSEKFYGLDDISGITDITDKCGETHTYVYGESSGATAEYLMKFGDEYDQLVLRGIADQPAPVEMEIYIDGEYKTTAQWNHNNLCNELTSVYIGGIEYGTHAIKIKYINDEYDPGQGIDKNFYLDALMVIPVYVNGIPIYVGDDIQPNVSSNPEGTTFILMSTDRQGNKGIHRMQPIIPKDGDSFIGQDGAVLSGATLIDDWFHEGNYWVASAPDVLHNEIYHEVTM